LALAIDSSQDLKHFAGHIAAFCSDLPEFDAATSILSLGYDRYTDGNANINFYTEGDGGGAATAEGARIVRGAGVNGELQIHQNGTENFEIKTNGSDALIINSSQNLFCYGEQTHLCRGLDAPGIVTIGKGLGPTVSSDMSIQFFADHNNNSTVSAHIKRLADADGKFQILQIGMDPFEIHTNSTLAVTIDSSQITTLSSGSGEFVIDPGSTLTSGYALHMTLTNTADGCLFETNSNQRGYLFETAADFATPTRGKEILRIVDANGADYGSGATLTPNSVNIAGGVGASDAVLTIGDRRSASGKAMLELHSNNSGDPDFFIDNEGGSVTLCLDASGDFIIQDNSVGGVAGREDRLTFISGGPCYFGGTTGSVDWKFVDGPTSGSAEVARVENDGGFITYGTTKALLASGRARFNRQNAIIACAQWSTSAIPAVSGTGGIVGPDYFGFTGNAIIHTTGSMNYELELDRAITNSDSVLVQATYNFPTFSGSAFTSSIFTANVFIGSGVSPDGGYPDKKWIGLSTRAFDSSLGCYPVSGIVSITVIGLNS